MRELNSQSIEIGCVEFEVSIKEPSMSWTIRIIFGPNIVRRTIGLRNVTCTACGGEHNDIAVKYDYSVVNFHALLTWISGELRVTDSVGSTGTYLNGYRLQRGESRVILASDEIRIGQTIITIARLNRNTSTKTVLDQRLHELALV